jgi:hypothetical protein
MAAQPNIWGIMVSELDDVASASRRPEPTSEQRYRQSRPRQEHKIAFPADAPEKGQGESGETEVLLRILGAIDKLMSPEDVDDDPPATTHAYQTARTIVESAYGRFHADNRSKNLPLPIVTTDERGGIRLSWEHGERHVRTNFGAARDLRSYLYFESPQEHEVDALEPDTLSARLTWMLKG